MPLSRIEEVVRVRYAETDAMGHAYYANYLVWFEMARSALFRTAGMPYSEVEALGFKLPVVEVGAKYLAEVKYDEELKVIATVLEMRRSSLRVGYAVHRVADGSLTTTGFTVHVMVNAEMRPVAIPDFVRALIQPEA